MTTHPASLSLLESNYYSDIAMSSRVCIFTATVALLCGLSLELRDMTYPGDDMFCVLVVLSWRE